MTTPNNVLINNAHSPGLTSIVFSRDGAYFYTGGGDCLARVWESNRGTDQEPDAALESMEAITCVAAGANGWYCGGDDSEVRHYAREKPVLQGMVTSANGVSIRALAVDPRGKRIAVASDETIIKVVDLEDTTKMTVLKGHAKAVRRVSWHPSGDLITSCGADGRIIVWDVSEEKPKEVEVIQGILPDVTDPLSPEWMHDCTAVWHTSGEYFFIATRTHELVTISRENWQKSATFTDEACSGAVTALAMSVNGVYLASSTKSGLYIWSTHNRRLMYRYQGALSAPITSMAWSPMRNLLIWVDSDGLCIRWPNCIPADGVDPVKVAPSAVSKVLPPAGKRKGLPDLFDFDAEATREMAEDPDADMNMIDMAAIDNDDWILDDLDGGMNDDDEKAKDLKFGGVGIREMVSVTKAQPPFQPGATPMENKKRYLAYNMIGVIEVTDQDTHNIVNVEFHDRGLRKGYHFTDHSKYDLASLGERGVVFACQPEAEHRAHVIYKPYGTWATQSEWTYQLPAKTTVLGVAAGGAPPSKSSRIAKDSDIQGQGNVVIATSDQELIFLTGSGIERHIMSLQGDFVSMVAGQEWVFVVHREGSTTMDGSQNLTGRLIRLDDFCLLQKDLLPIPKHHTLRWIGVSEEGAPAIYDSSGVLNILPRFRLPFQATWARWLNTNTLSRREGKHESYWPVGVSGNTFMCLILKGRQEYPGFPRPLMQELECRLPFNSFMSTEPKVQVSEERVAREGVLLDILRDGLAPDELTTDDISRRELALDKELIQLIQSACKDDRLGRGLDLARLLHHNASFDMAIKVAGFYHLVGLQEKMQILKDDRESEDRLESARDRRRERASDFSAVPAPRTIHIDSSRPRAFQDYTPIGATPRPGLDRAKAVPNPFRAPVKPRVEETWASEQDEFQSSAADLGDYSYEPSIDGKRKRSEEPLIDSDLLGKRRATELNQTRANPFARKTGPEPGRNPFNRNAEGNKSLHKSESFFNKVDAAEVEKPKRAVPAKGKAREKKEIGRQTTLFGLPAPEKDKKALIKKKKPTSDDTQTDDSQVTFIESPTSEAQDDTQATDVVMAVDSREATQVDEESQVPTQVGGDADVDGPIEWAPSPERGPIELESEA